MLPWGGLERSLAGFFDIGTGDVDAGPSEIPSSDSDAPAGFGGSEATPGVDGRDVEFEKYAFFLSKP